MAAMANTMATNHFGRPGTEILADCGRALMMSWKSSMEAEIMRWLTSVVVLAIVIKGSFVFAQQQVVVFSIVFFVSRIWVKLNGIWT